MITGDNAATAASIAAECGILPPDLFQQVEQEMQAARAHSSMSGQTSARLAKLLVELPLAPPMLERARNNGGRQQEPSWLDSWLHGLSGSVAGADPAAGLALMNSVVSSMRASGSCGQVEKRRDSEKQACMAVFHLAYCSCSVL